MCYLLPSAAFAEFPEEGVRQNISSQNTAVQVQQKQWLDILSEEERSPEKNENIGRPTLVNDDFLAANPHILEDALVQALNGNSADLVSSLVALYRKQPNHNPKLIARADALLAKLKGRTSEAVERYRTLMNLTFQTTAYCWIWQQQSFRTIAWVRQRCIFVMPRNAIYLPLFWKMSNVFKKPSNGRQNGNGLVESPRA